MEWYGIHCNDNSSALAFEFQEIKSWMSKTRFSSTPDVWNAIIIRLCGRAFGRFSSASIHEKDVGLLVVSKRGSGVNDPVKTSQVLESILSVSSTPWPEEIFQELVSWVVSEERPLHVLRSQVAKLSEVHNSTHNPQRIFNILFFVFIEKN